MKIINYLAIQLFSLLLILLLTGCKREEPNPVDILPATTQVGKNTFGCLINGKAFIAAGYPFARPYLQWSYPYINDSYGQGYFFSLSGSDQKHDPLKAIHFNGDSIILQQGRTYILKPYGTKGALYGEYGIYNSAQSSFYKTSSAMSGEIHFTRFDMVNFIVSGTFWFDALNAKGEKVEVREGRFDVFY